MPSTKTSASNRTRGKGKKRSAIESLEQAQEALNTVKISERAHTRAVTNKKPRLVEIKESKKKTPTARAEEFLNEPLEVVVQKAEERLFCGACRKFLSLKDSSLKSHFKCKMHRAATQRSTAFMTEQSALMSKIKSTTLVLPEPTLDPQIQAFRLQFTRMLLEAGISLNRSTDLRQFVEHYAFQLTSPTHLGSYIPILREHLRDELLVALKGQYVNFVFDSTTSFAETFCVTVRWLDDDLRMHTKLVSLRLFDAPFTGDQLGSILIHLILSPFFAHSHLLSGTHDSASVNCAAMRCTTLAEPLLISLSCLSHLADDLGSKLITPQLDAFVRQYHQLFAHSVKARSLFKNRFHEPYQTYSVVRWWSQYNQYRQILRLWSGIGQWLHDEQELDNSSLSALRQMLDDANMSGLIYLQLNVAFHFCKAWVEFTFKFEGDSFQADLVHDALTNLLELAGEFKANSSVAIPELDSELRTIANGDDAELSRLRLAALQMVLHAIKWWEVDVMGPNGHLKNQLPLYFACRFINPKLAYIHSPQTCVHFVETLGSCHPPLFTPIEVEEIQREMDSYRQELVHLAMNDPHTTLDWWRPRAARFPGMTRALKKIACLGQTSASCERVFSMLEQVLCSQQEVHALEDYIETYLLARYNHRH